MLNVAFAGPADTFGFGAAAMGRGLGGIALSDDVAGVFVNPAGLRELQQGTALLGYSLLRHDLPDMPSVRWDTNRDGLVDERDEPLSVNADYGRWDGLQLGLGRPLGNRIGLAVNAFIPADRLIDISTFDPSVPTWFMYENRQRRFEMAVGFGWEQLPGLYLGGTIQILTRNRFSLNATLSGTARGARSEDDQLLQLVEDVTLDIHSMSLDLEPELSPMIGMLWDVGTQIPSLDGLRLGATWRGPTSMLVDVDVDLQIDLAASEVGDLEDLTVAALTPFTLLAVDHYLPAQWGFGISYEHEDVLRVYVDARHTRWDQMPLNISVVSGEVVLPLNSDDPIALSDGNEHLVVLQSTWSPRMGGEVKLPTWTINDFIGPVSPVVRAGWSMEPTPLRELGENIATVDTDRMVISGGFGVQHGTPFELVAGPVSWDVFGQIHPLASGAVPVSYADPYLPGAPIGASSIPVGGRLWAAGLQWRMAY